MPTSQNGYSANDRSVIVSYTVPGGRLALRRGPAGELLAAAVRRWHVEVEPLLFPGCWGYAERMIRGSSTTLSNHASGTAADCSAPLHPLGADPARSFSAAKIAAVRKIVHDADGCLRWGGDYIGRKDGMHLEVIASEQRCAQVLARWRAVPVLRPLAFGMSGPAVAALQRFLNAYGWKPALPLLAVDGEYGPSTAAVVKQAQAQCGGAGADGRNVGPLTAAEFAKRGARW